MEISDSIQRTGLWKQLAKCVEYASTIEKIRSVAAKISAKTPESMADYTDHTVRHMDALWSVADDVLTREEMRRVEASEAFVLGAAFYIHDLGMAMSALTEGEKAILESDGFKTTHARLKAQFPDDPGRAYRAAVKSVTRDQHATAAHKLATEELPQLKRYLIEDSDVRDKWAFSIGQVAESHHWSLTDVERRLGARNVAPAPDRGQFDLVYVACLLRIIDFAHVNYDRADAVDRLLRGPIEAASIIHWDAQKDITGPSRVGDQLLFGCTKPINDIDAWWHFYDTAVQLDAEIKAVGDLLTGRTISHSRFSLQGVKGAEQPTTFNQFVKLAHEIMPLDIRVKADSMERVVELLGGKQLYGYDQLAPLRELIQNARDAVELRVAMERADERPVTPGEIAVTLREEKDHSDTLVIRDNGVGMSRNVVLRYLLSVGSNFWGSTDFYEDYGRALNRGFSPIGKFGIGFLSVFMFGNEVEVETEAAHSKRLVLHLRGVGKRGELRELPAKGITGTEVRITLSAEAKSLLKDLACVVQARAPMLQVRIRVTTSRLETPAETEQIAPNWWRDADSETFRDFVRSWRLNAFGAERNIRLGHEETDHPLNQWPSTAPEYIDDTKRLVSSATESPGVVVCSQGIAIYVATANDIYGIAEFGPIKLTVSRQAVDIPSTRIYRPRFVEPTGIPQAFYELLKPKVVAGLNSLERYGMIPGRLAFLQRMARIYTDSILLDTQLKWIPATQPSGDLIHVSRQGLIEQLRDKERFLLFSGCPSNVGYSYAGARLSSHELHSCLLIAIPIGKIDLHFERRDDLKREYKSHVIEAPLREVLSTIGIQEVPPLPRVIVTIAAEAWSIDENQLLNQMWYFNFDKFDQHVLWAALKRPRVTPEYTAVRA